MSSPAIAGPMARAPFTATPPSAAADRTCDGGTISWMKAWYAGRVSATPQPIRKVNVSSSAGDMRPASVRTVSAVATQAWNSCVPISIRRRSRMSASAPDGSASTSAGSIDATWTIATSASAPGSSTSSHWAPTVCIQVPIRLPTCASHSDRNVRDP